VDVDDDDVLRLLTNVTLEDHLTIDVGKTFTFDTNGNTLDFNNKELRISDSSDVTLVGCDKFALLQKVSVKDASAEFDASLELSFGLVADNAEVIVYGDVSTEESDAIYARNNAKVTVKNDVISKEQHGVSASTDSEVIVEGNVTGEKHGIDGHGSGVKVTVFGDVFGGNHAIYLSDGAEVEVKGSVLSEEGWGVYIYESTVTIGKNVIAAGGVHVSTGSALVTVSGYIEALYDGISAIGEGVLVTVAKTVKAGDIFAADGAVVEITGDVTLTGDDSAVIAAFGARITLESSLVVAGSGEGFFAVYCFYEDTFVEIKGNVTSDASGIMAAEGGTVRVDGKLTVGPGMEYVVFASEWVGDYIDGWWTVFDIRTAAQDNKPTTLPDYLTYTDGVSTVWIKVPIVTPPTGDSGTLLLIGALLMAPMGAGILFARRRRKASE
jgi:hypothetical protein